MKRPRPYILAESHWPPRQNLRKTVALLPWGATEAHNRHLPYGTDNVESDAIAAESARLAHERGANVIVLPTIPYGVNTGQLDIPLTINMNPSTQFAVLSDIVASVHRHGIRRLVILNSHGGNDFRQFIRELTPRYPDMFIGVMNWYQASDHSKYFEERDDHAGEMETSVMLHIAPDLVRPLSVAGDGRARPFRLRGLSERWVWTPRAWTKVTRDTGVGNPKKATAEKGKRYLADLTDQIAGFLVDLGRSNPTNLYR
jgi:creatinine amidohydrolase